MSRSDDRRRVLLTGATGNWGRATLRALRERPEIAVRALVLPAEAAPGAASRGEAAALRRARARTLAAFADMANLQVVRGDLTNPADVARAVEGVDLVLHLGALVSPRADEHPDLAWRTNVGGMRHLIDAIRARPDPGAVTLVGVGSATETGNRPEPVHWGRVGDPLRVSAFDEYGQTKVAAERLLVDSGLPRWVWLRQNGILHPGVLTVRDPIVTHTPLDGTLEWVSDDDSARLLVAIAAGQAPPDLWGRVWNIGGGHDWRLTNWEFHLAAARALGAGDPSGWFQRNWFSTGNFHGHWFSDSDDLEAIVPFRRDSFEDFLTASVASLPRAAHGAGRVPPWLVKHAVMGPLTRRPRGTMHAVGHRDEAAIAAHFGSLAAWRAIGDWSSYVPATPSRTPRLLDHGYDESVPPERWSTPLYRQAAAFRGGALLGEAATGDIATPLRWRCAFGHEFSGSPRLVLAAGHWCPECVRHPSQYAAQAERNAFLAQVEHAQRP